MNIIFLLFKSINKDMCIESSIYSADILNIIFQYCSYFENINFLFFLFNIKTTWKELYIMSKQLFFKTVSIILLKKHKFISLNNLFLPLIQSHKQVDHSFFAFLLRMCFMSLNKINNNFFLLDHLNDNNKNMVFLKDHINIKFNKTEYICGTDFFCHFIDKHMDILNIKKSNMYMINYINYLFGGNDNIYTKNINIVNSSCNNNCINKKIPSYNIHYDNINEYSNIFLTPKNIPLYILQKFISRIKKEHIIKLTKHKDIENNCMYKIAYYINEFILYLIENTQFNKMLDMSTYYKFDEINLCKLETYLNYDQMKLYEYIKNEDEEIRNNYYLILLKIYICNILYYVINYLNFLFLNNSKNFFFDCRGHLIFEKENEKEATSIIIWLSIKYICSMITSIVDFCFKYNLTRDLILNEDKYMNICQNIRDNEEIKKKNKKKNKKKKQKNNKKIEESCPKHDESTTIKQNDNNKEEKPNKSITFFNNEEVHFIIQNLLCLLLYSKHVACQQYLADCLLNICRIIVLKSNEEMQSIPLFYIYIILHIFKNENIKKENRINHDNSCVTSSNKKDEKDKNLTKNDNLEESHKDIEKREDFSIIQEKGLCAINKVDNEIDDNMNNNMYSKNKSYSNVDRYNNSDNAYYDENLETLNRIINKLNNILMLSEEENMDINDILSMNFIKHGNKINIPKNLQNDNNLDNDSTSDTDNTSYYNYNFNMNRKLHMLILDSKRININFLRKSNNMCLALGCLTKSYRIKEQYIIYNFIIKIILNYLYNGNNQYKKVICLNIIKHIYTTIDNKTLYEYINDIYNISLTYYKSDLFSLKNSSSSLYNILTKRLFIQVVKREYSKILI
ncbi:hypothetical protein PFLG_02117 [Plasmodium falciparum RAJ116]|uniref:Uncharacterized protein n=1 Tax=Plasmodium falciparum RAJ116 TaxID=580058 RepID=A0A0L0CZ23_PLAFA|nr:hypothetical protein PFLG_02117 [Plasmodium falciparum RAJ116]